jgi:2-hydroxy-3-oxopropionate reductase
MVGGKEEVFHRVLPFFQLMGKNITLIGANGDGQACKVANQIIVALNLEAVRRIVRGEGRRDPAKVRQALRWVSSRVLEVWRAHDSANLPGFRVELHEGFEFAQRRARGGLSLPNTATVQQLFHPAAHGGADGPFGAREGVGDTAGTQIANEKMIRQSGT